MDSIDYQTLYALQDKILDIVFLNEDIFYLTGGTALNRFYKEKRFSDDLDFFTQSSRFNYAVRALKLKIQGHFTVKTLVESKDFIRLMINNLLQVDFVNDYTFLYKEPLILENGYKIDTIENIFANKLTAILSRDNPKDIFDIYLIDSSHDIDFKKILEVAHKKASFSNDELLTRLKTFPKKLLQNIQLSDENFLKDFDEKLAKIINKIDTLSF